MSSASTTSPRAHANLPGYTFEGHSTKHFGFGDAQPVDVYRKRGGITSEVRSMERNQMAAHPDAPENWTMVRYSFKGESTVCIRVRA